MFFVCFAWDVSHFNSVFCTVQSSIASLDSAILYEAHGLIADMLADPAVPPHILTGLRAVSSLISPSSYLTHHNPSSQLRSSSSSSSSTAANHSYHHNHHNHNHHSSSSSSNVFYSKLSNNPSRHSSSLHHSSSLNSKNTVDRHHQHHHPSPSSRNISNSFTLQNQKRHKNHSTAKELGTCSSSPMLSNLAAAAKPVTCSPSSISHKQSRHSSERSNPTRISISLADFSSTSPSSSPIFSSNNTKNNQNKDSQLQNKNKNNNNCALNTPDCNFNLKPSDSEEEKEHFRPEEAGENDEEENEENEENPFLGESKSCTLAKVRFSIYF